MCKAKSDEEKDKYLAKSRKTQLAYKYKNMIYKKKMKKNKLKRPGNTFTFFVKEKKRSKTTRRRNISQILYCFMGQNGWQPKGEIWKKSWSLQVGLLTKNGEIRRKSVWSSKKI